VTQLALEDGTLWYEMKGSGPPLVFLHGGWQNSGSWEKQVDRFASEFTVVTVDFRGHGKTGATDVEEYTIDLYVDDLQRLLGHLGIENPILVGASIGGMVIQSYLDTHPAGARGAVIGGPLQSMPPVDLPPGMKSLASPLPAISGMLSTLGSRTTFQSLTSTVSATTGHPWLSTDSEVRSKAMDAVDEISRDEYLKVFRAIYRFQPPNLSHVQTPMLVLYGDHEVSQGKRQGERLASTVANGWWQEISDAGHLVNQDNPQAFNEATAAFLAGLAPPQELAVSD
jgi:pimeloyl-ACP methyl ester carboxylesterase